MSPRRTLVLLGILVVAAFAAAATTLPHSPTALSSAANAADALAPAALLAAWIVLTPALFPGTLLAAATGLVLGTAAGFGVALAGATLGGLVAFLLARHLGARRAADLAGARLSALREGVGGALDEPTSPPFVALVVALALAAAVPAAVVWRRRVAGRAAG